MINTKQINITSYLPDLKMPKKMWPLLLSGAFLLFHIILGGINSTHLLVASTVILYYYNQRTRLFIKLFFPFILVATVYDSMRYFYWPVMKFLNNIHVKEPYLLEKSLFGIPHMGQILTPNEFFQIHTYKILDFFCGFAYITFILEYLAMGFLLFFSSKHKTLSTFAWAFFWVNILGFITYYIYPAAPPWYVEKYGLDQILFDIPASSAAAARFDVLLGTHFFTGMYGMSADLYGAIPSLHVSYPLLVMWAAFKEKLFRIPATAFFLLMCFSAVYLQHHYIIDIILGLIYASFSIFTLTRLRKI